MCNSNVSPPRRFAARLAHVLIRAYQLSLSGLTGRQCRHLPTCSNYMDEAIARHGFWAGGWMGFARLCRCQPLGTSGYDPVPALPAPEAAWYLPWRYGLGRGPRVRSGPPAPAAAPSAESLAPAAEPPAPENR